MNRNDLITRLQDYLEMGKDHVLGVADTLDETYHDDVLPFARRTYKDGKKRVSSAEELLTDTVKEHQTAVVIIGLGVLALILVTIFAGTRTRSDW